MAVIPEDEKASVELHPIKTHYCFRQNIQGYAERYGVAGDNEAIKNLSYMERKRLLATTFGPAKAIRQTASAMNNKVDDDGMINRANYGARDDEIAARAKELE